MLLSKFLFSATAVVTTIFVITILAMVTMLLTDPESPANLWFNRNGAIVLTVEVILIGLFGVAAMIADRRETLREIQQRTK